MDLYSECYAFFRSISYFKCSKIKVQCRIKAYERISGINERNSFNNFPIKPIFVFQQKTV